MRSTACVLLMLVFVGLCWGDVLVFDDGFVVSGCDWEVGIYLDGYEGVNGGVECLYQVISGFPWRN